MSALAAVARRRPEPASTPPESTWSAFLARADGGNAFLTPEMVEVLRAAPGHRPAVWSTGTGTDVDALMVSVEVRTGPPVLRRWAGRSIAYGGLAVRPRLASPDSTVASLLASYQPPDGVLFTELRHVETPAVGALRAIAAAGFTWRPHLNFIIDLREGPEAILAGIGPRTRGRIRRALRLGRVRVDEVRDGRGLADWHRILAATYRRAGVPLADRRLFEAALAILVPRGLARFSLASVGGAPAACSLELAYRGRVHGWYGGADRSFSSEAPNEVLTYDVLRWASEAGHQLYDWGGAGEPDRPYGVRDFKARFGGCQANPGRSVLVHRPTALRLATAAAAVAYRGAAIRRNAAVALPPGAAEARSGRGEPKAGEPA